MPPYAVSELWPPLNIEGAAAVERAIERASTRLLVRSALARAVLPHLRAEGASEAEWLAELPAAPFDLGFYAEVVRGFFERTEWLAAVLRGEDPPLPDAPAPPLARPTEALNEAMAEQVVASLANPVAKRLLRGAVAWARRSLHARAPVAPFDLGFYARVLATLFVRIDWIEAMLRGENPDPWAAV
jgi:hypothetical protein